jgi:signal transduction histidine kinase
MFREFRIKIVSIIMGVLAMLFVGILIAIYSASLQKSNEYTNYMLSRLCSRDGFDILTNPKVNNDYLNSSKYYLVLIGEKQNIKRIYNDNSSGYSDQELSKLAIVIKNRRQQKGTYKDFSYLVKRKKFGTYIAISNDVFQNTYLDTLFNNILIFGSVGLVLLLIASIGLSKWLIAPLQTAFYKQKQFISDASHEIKTPLAVISSNADVLEQEIGENKWLDYIKNETVWMNKLVNNLLQMATIDAYEDKKVRTNINLSEIVISTVLPFESILYEKNIKFNQQIAEDIYMMGDSLKLGQLTTIFIDNAIRHTSPGGNITVNLKKSWDKRILSVSNTGKEIPPYEQKLIFERFYRMDKARTRNNGNYGLGLAIAKAIVHSHNGKISVYSKNNTTTFTAVL